MLGLMLEKIWHKKWMNFCLLLGCILLIATVSCFPLYRTAAYDRMLNEEFNNYLTTEGKWPTQATASLVVRKENGGSTITKMEEFPEVFYSTLNVPEKTTFFVLSLLPTQMESDTKRSDADAVEIRIGAINNATENMSILSGEGLSETGLTKDGKIEVLVSQSCLVNKNLLLGESFTCKNLMKPDGTPVQVLIKGVYTSSDDSGYFWQTKPEKLSDYILMKPELFREMFCGDNARLYTINCVMNMLFEYDGIKAADVSDIEKNTQFLFEESSYKSVLSKSAYPDILTDYNIKISRISTTLLILQVPVFAMLVAFLLMISGQMYEMEKNEISVIKSRGSSSGQIIRLYFYQSLLISVLGGVIGTPLGGFFARALGSTRNFLEFDFSEKLNISFTFEALIYVLVAVLVCLLSITIPSFKHSKVSIVHLKQSKALKKKAWWEKIFLDVLLLGVSLYGFYSFNKNNGDLSNAVMAGESLDPLLYISSSLFIVGAGLFFLRIQPYIVKLIYIVGKKWWGPASHVSFMEIIKNGRKQQLIMLFLVMTISLGMYHATVARTILSNAIENTEYLAGTDVVIKENWTEITDMYGTPTGEYVVPDYTKFNSLEAAEKYTKVLYDARASVKGTGSSSMNVVLMGIHTKEFGEMTMVDTYLNNKNYYSILNELAVVENGMIVSSNFNTKLGYNVGDSLTVSNSRKKSVTGKIVGFVDYFPGFSPVENGLNPDGTAYSNENYLVVSHFEYVNKKLGTTPYELWIQLKDGYGEKDVYNWITEKNLRVSKYINKEAKMNATLQNPLLQGTNGVLTMGFVVTIILCAVGYLIFWVMSIKERELIFGVLRATGLHKTEIIRMLVIEQLFSGLFSVFAGIGIGKITSVMFVPILQRAYASEDQVLPMRLITVASDMYRLYAVIALVILFALFVIIGILSKMNVTKALKLGEE